VKRLGAFIIQATDVVIAAIVAYLCISFLNWSGAWSSEDPSEVWRVLLMDAILVILFFGFWSMNFFSRILLKDPLYLPERALAMPASLVIAIAIASLLSSLGITEEKAGRFHFFIFLVSIIVAEGYLEKTLKQKPASKTRSWIKTLIGISFWGTLASTWFLLICGRLSMFGLIELPALVDSASSFILNDSLDWFDKNA